MTTVLARDLLPASSDPFERAALQAMIDDLPVPVRECLDPDTCPAEFLPFLAHANSVDLWSDDWSEDRKRQIIAEWPEIAARLGTLDGIRRILKYVDAELVDVMAPPQRFVMGEVDDKAIAAWKARLPQLRVYNRSRPAPKRGEVIGKFVIGRSALVSDVAWAYTGPEGVIFDPQTGTETSLKSVDIRQSEATSSRIDIRRAIVPGRSYRRSFVMGRAVLGKAVLGNIKPTTVVTWNETETAKSLTETALVEVAGGGWQPIDPRWDEVPVTVPRRNEATCGHFVIGRSVLSANRAELSYYRRLYLSNPAIVAPGTRPMGRARIGRTPHNFPPFTARLLIRLRQFSTPRSFVMGRAVLGQAVVRELDTRATSRVLSALRIAKAPEEQFRVTFETQRRITFGDRITFDGTVTFGTFVDRNRL